MRRRPLAVYRVIDEVELLGEPQVAPESGPAVQAGSLDLADDPHAGLGSSSAFLGRHAITLAVLAFGLLALIAATLITTAPARHLGSPMRAEATRRRQAQAGPSHPVQLAVRVQTRITDSMRRPLGPRARHRGPYGAVRPRHARAKRPPRVRQLPAVLAAPPAAAPVTAGSSPASEFGFER